ncbi:hypothetical protein ABEB36_012490 [Hypothenemus hampei]|uniref:Uncharacterized protein n=1 Tax=Hypothenemus hampei TaxID=57062 RepID=A0ABD1EC44_HYPHA
MAYSIISIGSVQKVVSVINSTETKMLKLVIFSILVAVVLAGVVPNKSSAAQTKADQKADSSKEVPTTTVQRHSQQAENASGKSGKAESAKLKDGEDKKGGKEATEQQRGGVKSEGAQQHQQQGRREDAKQDASNKNAQVKPVNERQGGQAKDASNSKEGKNEANKAGAKQGSH